MTLSSQQHRMQEENSKLRQNLKGRREMENKSGSKIEAWQR